MSDLQERPLSAEDEQAYLSHYEQAFRALRIENPDATPEEIVELVEAFVDKWQLGKFKRNAPGGNAPDSLKVAQVIGTAWGYQLVRRLGWEWVYVVHAAGETPGVVSPDRSLVIYPFFFIQSCLDDPKVDCTVVLSFNMLAAGTIPQLPANGFENVMNGVARIVPKR